MALSQKERERWCELLVTEPMTRDVIDELRALAERQGSTYAAQIADALMRFLAQSSGDEVRALVVAEASVRAAAIIRDAEEKARAVIDTADRIEAARTERIRWGAEREAQAIIDEACTSRAARLTAFLGEIGNEATCKYCKKPVWFVLHAKGVRWLVFDDAGPHFGNCQKGEPG